MATLMQDTATERPTIDAVTRSWGEYTAHGMVAAALDATAWQDSATDEFPEGEE